MSGLSIRPGSCEEAAVEKAHLSYRLSPGLPYSVVEDAHKHSEERFVLDLWREGFVPVEAPNRTERRLVFDPQAPGGYRDAGPFDRADFREFHLVARARRVRP